jgi:hypothetical protein
MRWFRERDVRRIYDLLQHKPDLGLTQLVATDGSHIIGLGLFDNEADFVSECRRYNRHGTLTVGVNPRSGRLLDQFGGLRNRMRTLFADVVSEADVTHITGIAVPAAASLSGEVREYVRDASVLDDGRIFLAMDEAVAVAGAAGWNEKVVHALFGGPAPVSFSLLQAIPVTGTALAAPGFFRRRHRFVKYRPYLLDGLAARLRAEAAPP